MKDFKKDLSKEELIKLLQKHDAELQAYENAQKLEFVQSQRKKIELLKKQKQIEEKRRLEREISGKRNINLLQKFVSEANIKKSEIDKTQNELEVIDRQLIGLLNNSKRRVGKLANKFVDLSKEKTELLTENQIDSRTNVSNDIKSISRYYEDSIKRNKLIIDEESSKEKEAQKNIAILTQTIDLNLLNDDEENLKDDLNSLKKINEAK